VADRSSSTIPLQLSREQLAVVLAGIVDGITALNPAGKLVYSNDIAARLIGYPCAQALLAVPNADILSKFELFDDAGQPLSVEDLPSRRALRGLTEPPRGVRAHAASRFSTCPDRLVIFPPVFNRCLARSAGQSISRFYILW
jgi:PAS domain-containing protein